MTHKDEDPRSHGAQNLRQFVNSQYRTLTSDQFTSLLQILHDRIFKLINGNQIHEMLGGILAVGVLIDFDTQEYSGKNTPRFSGYLRKALSHSDERVLLLASQMLGMLVKAEGALTADCVEFEATRALEWLQGGSRYESRRLAAVLILKELAENAPTLFFKYNKELREAVWIPLSDSKSLVRLSTLQAISATLRIISGREQLLRTHWYSRLYEEAARTLAKGGSNSKIHSALLVVAELLQESITGRFMDPHFLEICELVFKYKSSRESPVRKDILSLLIPRMAHYSPSEFVNSHLNACTLHLFSLLKKESERDLAFYSLGEVAVAVGERFKPYLTPAIATVKTALKEKRGNSLPAIVCVSMLARALGRALTPFLDDIVPFLVSVDFSPESTAALTEIGSKVPAVLPAIQEQMLNKISLILDKQSFRSIESGNTNSPVSVLSSSASLLSRGSPKPVKNLKPASFLSRSSETILPATPVTRDNATIALALQALSSFVVQSGLLWEFVRSCVITYLSHSSPIVRKEAVLTCARLLVPPGQSAPTRGGAGQ
ncbi:MAG: hypothetical protein Q8P67_01525, partial [archaeon]|nr:hypothetical protein [archaeon]